MKRQRPEQPIQRAIPKRLNCLADPSCYRLPVGNGESWWRAEVAIVQTLGSTTGICDPILIRDGRAYGFELKSHRDRLSSVQATEHLGMRRASAVVELATTRIDAAVRHIENWVPLRGCAT
jgi:hypothetical protein